MWILVFGQLSSKLHLQVVARGIWSSPQIDHLLATCKLQSHIFACVPRQSTWKISKSLGLDMRIILLVAAERTAFCLWLGVINSHVANCLTKVSEVATVSIVSSISTLKQTEHTIFLEMVRDVQGSQCVLRTC